MHVIKILFMILICASIASCDLDDPESFAQKEIRDILYEISLDFNLGDVVGIMDHVHQNYLHQGEITWQLNNEILDRMGRFQLLEIEVLYIEINGSYAVAHTIDHYSSSIENVSYEEPEYSGYFSYFYRENGSWLIYGNQSWNPERKSRVASQQIQILDVGLFD